MNGNSERTKYKMVVDKTLNRRSFHCIICNLKLSTVTLVKNHLLEYHDFVEQKLEKVVHQCSKCDYETGGIIKLVMHMKNTHDSDELYHKCTICPYKTPAKGTFKEHMNEVHFKLRHTCNQCGYKARRNSDIRNHKLRAHEGMTFSCDICTVTKPTRDMVNTHKKVIHENTFCDTCDLKCVGSKGLKEHQLKDHENKIINCTECDYVSYVKLELTQHRRFSHPRLKEPFKCLDCDYSTFLKLELAAHEKMQHIVYRIFKCDTCEYHVDSKRSLKLHKALEHVLKRSLDNCFSRFEAQHLSLLRNHSLKMKLDKELILGCSECGHETRDILDMKIHQVSHSVSKHSKELMSANIMKVKKANVNKFDSVEKDGKGYSDLNEKLRKAQSIEHICDIYPDLVYNKRERNITCKVCFDKSRPSTVLRGHHIQRGVLWTDTVVEPKDVANGSQNNTFKQLKSKAKCHIQGKFHCDKVLKQESSLLPKEIPTIHAKSKYFIQSIQNKVTVTEDANEDPWIKVEEIEDFEEGEVKKSFNSV